MAIDSISRFAPDTSVKGTERYNAGLFREIPGQPTASSVGDGTNPLNVLADCIQNT